MNPFEKLAKELKRLETGYREESYYRPLCDFLESHANGRDHLHMTNVVATNNPSSESIGEGVGFPDIEIRQDRKLIGYIEVKSPNQNLDSPAFSTQFSKYKESLENIIFTNFKKWTLYTWDKDGKPQKTEEAEWNYQQDLIAEQLKKLLTVFFEGQSYQAKTPHQLAIALARKTRLLSHQVEEAIKTRVDKRLVDLKETFEKTLIQNIGDHQFANIYAETIAYSLFLAKLEHYKEGGNEDFTLRTAVDYLPKSVPIFKDLYQLTGGTVAPVTQEIHKATELLIEQLCFADIAKIYKKLVEHKPGEDPVIQFYEPFLSEYDPEERKARGVYYTPKPVVDYIVRSVDFILKTKFNRKKGLGDESVQILDPATGTGTFLMSVIQNIYADIEKENTPLGNDAIKRKFKDVVSSHILKHLYGFELLVAPYAIAHLKLTLELERLGFDFSLTENDQDKENDRLKIFLANTLDDPEKQPIGLFGFESITRESEDARIVKKEKPIMAIVGNPPYSVSSSNNKIEFILNLIEDYKHGCGVEDEVRIAPIQDDYIKFIRFTQWKMEQVENGVIGFITNNSYLDGIIHRAMRLNLLKFFTEIYIVNLHGNTKLGEKSPNGEIDENVFPHIQTGVSIIFLIKKKKELDNINLSTVWYKDIYGKRVFKYNFLIENNLNSTSFKQLLPKSNYYFFTDRDITYESEYGNYLSLSDAFIEYKLGVMTGKDHFVLSYDKDQLTKRLQDLVSNKTDEELRNRYDLADSRDWTLKNARKINLASNKMTKILYRPFDELNIFYDNNLLASPQRSINAHLLNQNLALLFSKQLGTAAAYNNWLVTKGITEMAVFKSAKSAARIAPLYLYPDDTLFSESKKSNYSEKFIDKIKKILDLEYVLEGQGDLISNFGPEDIFYYSYAVFHSPTYRSRYSCQLKIDYPRLPLTTNKDLFRKLVQKGNELVNLHLLGENPFDKSKTIFDDTSRWNVKIAGNKPQDTEDWKVMEVRYDEKSKRVYINSGQYFEGIGKEVWEFMVGGYQVLDKWLKDRRKAGRTLSYDDQIHYMKVIVSLRETIRLMKEIDQSIPNWPIQ
ncbi:MAG: hypothetical protein A3C22_01860 [Candidatus Levybacteria bacterium RIFCSPHIGHO2_02_FULL_37_10]|nr:MAG: hypothetical protein A3C22_01860 [Candidatus Levybacteria bacterium RIFCSPHIGHO2_02_FULL_37_10]